MFVDIDDFKSAIAVENMLMPYTKGRVTPDKKSRLPKEHITPDVCWQILKSTNNPVNIQHMLECIKELPASEQTQFKDVVLATFSNREQPNKQPHNIVLLGKKLAAANGFEDELAEAMKTKEGDLLSSASHVAKSFVTFENTFYAGDFSPYDRVIFLSSEKIELYGDLKFPKNMEFPNSSDVYFGYTDEHDFIYKKCDFNDVQSISFKDGAKVSLISVKNLPPNLDFSRCDNVFLEICDLQNVQSMLFKDGAIVNLQMATKKLPPNLDVSRCSEVYLCECDLSNQQDIRFKDGAIVKMLRARNLPHNIDFSRCDEVALRGCDLDLVEKLTFKNREQMEKGSAKIPDDWKGKLVFADEQPQADLTNMAFMANAQGGR